MNKPAARIDQFFTLHAMRNDRWQVIADLARDWMSSGAKPAELLGLIDELAVVEEFHAIPGRPTVQRLRALVEAGDAQETARLARHVAEVLVIGRGSDLVEQWEAEEDAVASGIVPSVVAAGEAHRPYFEVLFVTAQEAPRWKALADQVRRLRRQGRPVRLRAGLRRFLRGRHLRHRAEPAPGGGGGGRQRAASVPARCAHHSRTPRADGCRHHSRFIRYRAGARHQAHAAGARPLHALGPQRGGDRRRSQGRLSCAASSTRSRSRWNCTCPSSRAWRRATRRPSSTT